MLKAFRVGSVRGIPIKLDVTLLLILPVIAFLIGSRIEKVVSALNEGLDAGLAVGPLTVGATPWLLGLGAGIGLFVCVLLHELGHAAVARQYGYEVGSITLWLLGGVARPEDQPERWHHEFWIAVAGPIVSIGLGIGCYLVFSVLSADPLVFLFGYLALLNIVLAVFNLLPAFPLDGGRVLRAILGRTRSHVEATSLAVSIGKGFAVLFAIVGILSLNVFLIGVAFFVYLAAAAEGKQTILQAAFEGVLVADVMTPASEVQTLPPDQTLDVVLDRMFRERHTGYPVVRDGELRGIITLNDVRDVDPEARETTTVAQAMSTDLKTIPADADAMDAIRKLSTESVGRLVVTGPDGELVGLVTRSDLVTAMNVVQERQLTDSGGSLPT